MINIAIDGPGGAGKSTVAREAAERMGLHYVDTVRCTGASAIIC